MATVGTTLHTLLHGRYVGRDEFGNRYYKERRNPKHRRQKRWVIYKGLAEPSKVPPHWHAWLHYTTDAAPIEGVEVKKFRWQQGHLPNLTGTPHRYLPQGHVLKNAKRAPTTADYVPWKPE